MYNFKLTVSEGDKVIESFSKAAGSDPSLLLKTLQEFQHEVNASLTKLIDNSNEESNLQEVDDDEDDEDGDDEDEDDITQVSPKRSKHI